MNLSYALLGCSSVMASVVLARLFASREPAVRVLGWLGRNWLIFFYLQFALSPSSPEPHYTHREPSGRSWPPER